MMPPAKWRDHEAKLRAFRARGLTTGQIALKYDVSTERMSNILYALAIKAPKKPPKLGERCWIEATPQSVWAETEHAYGKEFT